METIIVKQEVIPAERLKKMIDNYDRLPNIKELEANAKKHLFNLELKKMMCIMHKNLKTDKNGINTLKVEYRHSESPLKESPNYGRLFAKGSISLQSMQRSIRHTLAHDIYNDIDMKNAHPTIMLQYCKKHKYPCDGIEYYVEHREDLLNKLMKEEGITREEAKRKFLSVSYGKLDATSKVKEFMNYVGDIKKLHGLMLKDQSNAEIIEFITKNKATFNPYSGRPEVYNTGGKLCGCVMNNIENNILQACMEFLGCKKINTKNIVMVFDGFMILKEIFNPSKEVLGEMSKYCLDKTGYKMTFENKPMDEVIDLSVFGTEKKSDVSPSFCEMMEQQDRDLSEVAIAEYIKILKPNTFIWVNGEPYFYNGRYYVYDKNHSEMNNYLSSDFYNQMKAYFDSVGMLDNVSKTLSKLKTHKFKVEVGKTASDMLKSDIVFDNNPDILPFNNVVYELKTGIFRDYRFDDYVLTTTGYDWEEPIEDETKTINSIIDKILYEPTAKRRFMTLLSTGLDGHLSDKFTILTGKGGNGKSLLKTLVEYGLGNFFYKMNNSVLEGHRGGPDPNIANMCGKRLVFISEPPSDRAVDNSIIKELTGDKTTNARLLFKNETKTKLNCSLMMDCNELPSLKNGATNAEKRRYDIIPFDARFTFFANEINESKHIYKANKHYMEDDFLEDHKRAMIKILMGYYSEYIKNGKELPESKPVRDETEDYLKQSDELSEILDEILENERGKTTDIKTIYDELPEKMKRQMTCRLMCEKMKKSAYYGASYNCGNKNRNIRAHLEGYVLKSAKTAMCI